MKMKKWLLKTGLLLLLVPVFAGCGGDDETTKKIDIPAQRAAFMKFLDAKELVYTTTRDSIFKYTVGPNASGRTVTVGDQVSIRYAGGVFNSTTSSENLYGFGGMFTTNVKLAAQQAGMDGLELLLPDPLDITLGRSGLIRGLDLGMQGSRLGDTVLLYITSDLAYNNEPMGLLAAGTPVVFEVILLEEEGGGSDSEGEGE